jgi:hypothetical protein
LDGLSLSGDHFFYDNVVASNGQHQQGMIWRLAARQTLQDWSLRWYLYYEKVTMAFGNFCKYA